MENKNKPHLSIVPSDTHSEEFNSVPPADDTQTPPDVPTPPTDVELPTVKPIATEKQLRTAFRDWCNRPNRENRSRLQGLMDLWVDQQRGDLVS